MKISTSTSLLTNYLLDEAVDSVISLGFDAVDVWCGRPHLYRKDYSEDLIISLGKKIKESGLLVPSVMPAFFRYPYSLCSPLKTVCDDSVRYMKDCIDNAILINAESVLIVPTSSLFFQTQEDARKIFIQNLAKICDYADSKKMLLNLEVLSHKVAGFVFEMRQAVQIIRELGTSNMGIVLDTGHLNLAGESIESALDTAGELLKQVHINDNNSVDQTNSVPGDGNFDFVKLNRLLKNNDYNGVITLELGGQYSSNPEHALSTAIVATKALFC